MNDQKNEGAAEFPSEPILAPSFSQSVSRDLHSEITYELVSGADSEGNTVPVHLGRGRFAKVYKAWQRSAGLNVRPVAIKILHENIERKSEQLFLQEIRLLKKVTAAAGVNVISILDILQLGPMAMCANCGKIYHPRCPLCGEALLERFDPPQELFSALRCRNHTRCKFIVSGEHILNGAYALFQPPSKTCCAKEKGARATRGTLINFVDRDAVVMELLDQKLPDFHENRRRTYARLCRQHGVLLPGQLGEIAENLDVTPLPGVGPPQPAGPAEVDFVQKVMLLEKVLLMVQTAEAVSWMHSEQQIVHKDLAPDNIMIATKFDDSDGDNEWRGLSQSGLGEALTSLATHPCFTAKVIDVGLADQTVLTRTWYEEPVQNFAAEKLSYLSLEARQRKRRIYQRIEFNPQERTFIVPDSLRPDKAGELAVKPGDLLVDESDIRCAYSIEIVGIEPDINDRRIFRARYEGELPPNAQGRQFDLVMRLGEAHDIYSLGAVFYFILTGEHTDVRKLTNIADLLQDAPLPLRADVLSQTIPSYEQCRDKIPEKFHRDDLMVLILRAMVRGLPESFVQSRIDRGPEPARRMLHETRRIYNQLKAELLSTSTISALEEIKVAHGALQETNARTLHALERLRAAHEQVQVREGHSFRMASRQQKLLQASLCGWLLTALAAGGYFLSDRLLDKPAGERHSQLQQPSATLTPPLVTPVEPVRAESIPQPEPPRPKKSEHTTQARSPEKPRHDKAK